MLKSFRKKHKIKNMYKYSEIKKVSGSTEFGWLEADDIDIGGKVVLSYPSKSKSFMSEDTEWSNSEGVSAISYNDYVLYFKSLTSLEPDEFVSRYSDDQVARDAYLTNKYNTITGKDIDYIDSLARLLGGGDRFIIYGRIFKIIENNT